MVEELPGSIDEPQQVELLEEWVGERSVLGYVTRVADAPQLKELTWARGMPSSVYSKTCEFDDRVSVDDWERIWHDTHVNMLWSIFGYMG